VDKKEPLFISDKRMIKLIEILTDNGAISYRQDFLDEIGLIKQNYRDIANGRRSFTVKHIYAACKAYKVNLNWIFGIERNTFR
jgi:hypothetical protein